MIFSIVKVIADLLEFKFLNASLFYF